MFLAFDQWKGHWNTSKSAMRFTFEWIWHGHDPSPGTATAWKTLGGDYWPSLSILGQNSGSRFSLLDDMLWHKSDTTPHKSLPSKTVLKTVSTHTDLAAAKGQVEIRDQVV